MSLNKYHHQITHGKGAKLPLVPMEHPRRKKDSDRGVFVSRLTACFIAGAAAFGITALWAYVMTGA